MKWLEPWIAIADLDWPEEKKADYCSAWEAQLGREVGPRHLLRGENATLIARRFDTDDALFQLADGQIAEVHLTWSRGQEPDPKWPRTVLFASINEWARDSLEQQHRDWVGGEH